MAWYIIVEILKAAPWIVGLSVVWWRIGVLIERVDRQERQRRGVWVPEGEVPRPRDRQPGDGAE